MPGGWVEHLSPCCMRIHTAADQPVPATPTFVLQVQDSDVEETLQLLSMRQLAEQGREVPCSPTAGTAGTAGTSSAAAAPAHKQEQQAALAPLAQLLEAAGREWAARAAHIRACLQEGGACDRCAAVVRVLCVAPCACLLCVDCASSQRTACPKCAQPYRMQVRWLREGSVCCGGGTCSAWRPRCPRAVLPFMCCLHVCCESLLTSCLHDQPSGLTFATHCPTNRPPTLHQRSTQPVDDPGRLADNPHPKWEVPLELIEWQPAYTQRGGLQLCREASKSLL